MGATTKQCADVFAKHANIGTLAAHHTDTQKRRFIAEQLELMDRYLARFTLQRDTCTRIFVQGLAVALERRMHWRYLRYLAAKLLQRRLDLRKADIDRLGAEHFAFGVAGVGDDTQMDNRLIGLVRFQQILRKL